MTKERDDEAPIEIGYLAIFGVDVERWRSSRAYKRMSLAAQGAYLNLCFEAWSAQPSCILRADDRELWRRANAASPEDWQRVKSEVFDSDAWAWVEGEEGGVSGWLNEVVLESYQEAARLKRAAIRSGRVAGKASARVRRSLSKLKQGNGDRTTVERPLNDRAPRGRSTTVNPPSPSPSPSPTTECGWVGTRACEDLPPPADPPAVPEVGPAPTPVTFPAGPVGSAYRPGDTLPDGRVVDQVDEHGQPRVVAPADTPERRELRALRRQIDEELPRCSGATRVPPDALLAMDSRLNGRGAGFVATDQIPTVAWARTILSKLQARRLAAEGEARAQEQERQHARPATAAERTIATVRAAMAEAGRGKA